MWEVTGLWKIEWGRRVKMKKRVLSGSVVLGCVAGRGWAWLVASKHFEARRPMGARERARRGEWDVAIFGWVFVSLKLRGLGGQARALPAKTSKPSEHPLPTGLPQTEKNINRKSSRPSPEDSNISPRDASFTKNSSRESEWALSTQTAENPKHLLIY